MVIVVAVLVLFVGANILVGLWVDRLWFDSVGFRSVFNTRISTQIWLFFAGFGIALMYLVLNMAVAWRLRPESGGEMTSPFPEFPLPSVLRAAQIIGVLGAVFLSIILGAVATGQWEQILQFINAEPFGVTDPQFDRDVGFFVFKLEPLQFMRGWATALSILALLSTMAVYGFRFLLHQGDATASQKMRIHLALMLIVIIGLFVWSYWLARFELAVSENGTVFGATYTDVNIRRIALVVMMVMGGLVAATLLSWPFHRRLALPAGALGLLVAASIGGNVVYPAVVQRFTVEPDELNRESEFIVRNIEATRFAFGLDQIEERDFAAADRVTVADTEANPEALANIRLWDHRPLNDTLNTIQTIRPLYEFPDVDVDRYEIDGEVRQVFLAARELSQDNLQPNQRSWVNRVLQFTHGFGVTVSTVDEVSPAGEPEFVVSNIPPEVSSAYSGAEETLTVTQPRIYYGEDTSNYVIVNSDSEEFDFPLTPGASEDDEIGTSEQVRTRYDGDGGVELGSFFKRLAFAWEMGDTNILISGSVKGDSRILFRRNIQDRISELAPFLGLDADPYVVIGDDGRLYWIQDAYTTTDRFPYSQPHVNGVNYIRNSVKAVVDAFNGSVDFYIVDETDPIIRVWNKIFPDLFLPNAAFPEDLRAHWRYPQDLFQIQSDQYLTYHITAPSTLFNREDIWAIPQEVLREQKVELEPYYVTQKLPDSPASEFLLILPFTPRNRSNAIAWLAGRSDGDAYGKLFAFRFPANKNIDGPEQIEARIDQDVSISRQFTLLGQEGSSLIRGNLLFIPVGNSYVYVEPIYLQAELARFPQLKGVVVVNGDRIALEATLDRASSVALGLSAPAGLTAADGTPIPVTPPPVAEPPPAVDEDPPPAADEDPEPDTPGSDPPSDTPLPESVPGLIAEANAALETSMARLAEGDFAGYGVELARLERALEALAEAVGESP